MKIMKLKSQPLIPAILKNALNIITLSPFPFFQFPAYLCTWKIILPNFSAPPSPSMTF